MVETVDAECLEVHSLSTQSSHVFRVVVHPLAIAVVLLLRPYQSERYREWIRW